MDRHSFISSSIKLHPINIMNKNTNTFMKHFSKRKKNSICLQKRRREMMSCFENVETSSWIMTVSEIPVQFLWTMCGFSESANGPEQCRLVRWRALSVHHVCMHTWNATSHACSYRCVHIRDEAEKQIERKQPREEKIQCSQDARRLFQPAYAT